MKNVAFKVLSLSTIALSTGLLSSPVWAADIMARVISSTPVVQQVAVPRQVCSQEAVVTQAPKSGAGALMGGLAGGAVGNSVGQGSGRALATIIGVVGGAMLGDRVEGSHNQVQNVQHCTTQSFYENRPSHYNVVYEYAGTQYNVQMPNDPGPYMTLQVTPVGAMNQPPAQVQVQVQQAPVIQPQSYVQPMPVQPVYVQQSAPVVYYSAPVYNPPVYYPRPSYYAPIGLSLNLGYGRRHGHHHWR